MNVDWYRFNKIIFVFVIILCAGSFTFLFYKMATCDYIDAGSPYYSDIIFHIRDALTTGTYSLMGIITMIFYKLQCDVASLLLALFITAMVILTIYSTYLLLLELDKVTGKETRAIDRVFYQWFSLISVFIVSIYLPDLLPSYYFNTFSLTCWHSDTYIAMRPFSILTLVYFFRIYNGIDSGLNKKELVIFGSSLLLSTWMKPNFFTGFAVFLLIVAVWNLIKAGDRRVAFKRWVILAILTIPSVICLSLQNYLLFFNGTEGGSIIFDPLSLVELRVINWPISLVFLLIFPVAVLLFECKYLNKKSFSYVMIWLIWAILILYGLLLVEDGPRILDFNFNWGMTFANGLLYIGSFHMWYSRIRAFIIENVPFIMGYPKVSKGMFLVYLAIGVFTLSYLIYVGINYFVLIYNGNSFALL